MPPSLRVPSPASPPQNRGRLRWLLPVLLFLFLAALSCSYAKHRRLALEDERNADFQREAAQATVELRERLQFHAQFLRAVAAFFASSDDVSADEWRLHAARVDAYRHLPGMLAYGYAPRVARKHLAALVDGVNRDRTGEAFRVYPEGEGTLLFPVVYLAPGKEVALRARGFDLYSEAQRRQTIDRATEVDDIVITPTLVLVHDRVEDQLPSFLMFRPVYRRGMPIGHVSERRAALAGVAFAAYRMSEFLETTRKTISESMAMRVFDAGADSDASPAHDTRPDIDWHTLALRTEHEIDFGYRTWRLEFGHTGDLQKAGFVEPALIIAGGLTIALLLAAGIFLLLTQRELAMSYAARATAELRAAEEGIRARDQFKQAILDGATEVSVVAADTSGTITLFNRGAEKMLGYPAEALVGKATPAAFHLGEEIEARGRELEALLGTPVQGFDVFVALPQRFDFERREWTYVRKDGCHLRVDLTVTALRGGDGQIAGYLGIAIDVTEKRAAQEKLAHHHDMMETILANVPCGISLIDQKLNFIAANDKLLEVLDFPRELFAQRTPTFREVALFNARRGEYGPGDPDALADALMAKAANPQPHHFERIRPDGRVIEVRGTPLKGGGFVTLYMDVSERKRIEEELVRHRDNLQAMVAARTADLSRALQAANQAHQAKSEFLANMSHELRTPMHAIMSFSRLGMERIGQAPPERVGQYFERIRQSAERLVLLINDLLDLSKLEAGRMLLTRECFEVAPLLSKAVRDLESLLPPRALCVELRVETFDTWITGDRVQIERVVHNLLSNAIKFSPDGGLIDICVGNAMTPQGDSALRISFSDSGVGIPAGELEDIFEKFVQSSATKTGAGGTGLGLAISREIIVAHHGTIAASNNPGGGATFTVTLPISGRLAGEGEPVI